MKLKYHKIPKVDKEICTAEALVAYNYAFSYASDKKTKYENFKNSDLYNGVTESDFFHDCINLCMKMLSDEMRKKYNVDAIQSCLNAGMETYFKLGCPIVTSYKRVGEIFKSQYL